MSKNELYGKMENGKIPTVQSIATESLTTDLGKWAPMRNAIFAHDVLNGKLPDMEIKAEGRFTSGLNKWAEHNKEVAKEAAALRKNSDLEKMIAEVTKEATR